MQKTVILLSGTPQGKQSFAQKVKEIAWVWQINPKDHIKDNAKTFYWDGVKTEEIYKYVGEQLPILNRYFNYEQKYLEDKIERFLSDDDEYKRSGDKVFDKFILVVHGVSKDLVPFLQEEYGVFRIHISKKEYNSSEKFPPDVTMLYEDEDKFTIEVNRVIEILTKNGG
jgi:hypothetical protein